VDLFVYFERERESIGEVLGNHLGRATSAWLREDDVLANALEGQGRAVRRVDNVELPLTQPNALLLLGQLCGSRMVGQPPKAFNSLGSRWLFRRESQRLPVRVR